MAEADLKQVPATHRATVLKVLMAKVLGGQAESDDLVKSAAIISRIAETLERNERRRLAKAIAHSQHAPAALIRKFACDEIFVAEPVLRWSPRITAEFLKGQIQQLSEAHLLIVSRRSDLTSSMAEVLISIGSAGVHKTIALNAKVPLDKRLILELTKSAAAFPEIEEALCGRKDLPNELYGVLISRISQRLQEKVGMRAKALDPAALQLALRTVEIQKGCDEGETHSLSIEKFVEITRLAKLRQLTERNLIEFISARDLGAVVVCFGHLANVSPNVSRELICNSAGEGLAVAVRAANLDRATMDALARFRAKMHLTEMDATKQLEVYDSIPTDTARKVMAFHAARRSKAIVG